MSHKCPLCEGSVDVYYTQPAQYKCRECGAELYDVNDEGIVVLSEDMARRKRPQMYGGPICECCSHAPHPGQECEFCKYESQLPEVRLMSRSSLSPRDQERLKQMELQALEDRKKAEDEARAPDEGRYYKD